jgi:hypothetical protein
MADDASDCGISAEEEDYALKGEQTQHIVQNVTKKTTKIHCHLISEMLLIHYNDVCWTYGCFVLRAKMQLLLMFDKDLSCART